MPMNQVDVTRSGLLEELDALREHLSLASRHTRGPSPDQSDRADWCRSILDDINALVYVCASDGKVEFVNTRLKERVGSDVVGEPCHRAIHGLQDPCAWCGKPAHDLASAEPVVGEYRSPRDGRWYQEAGAPVRHPDGSYSWVMLLVDITDRVFADGSRIVQHELGLNLNAARRLEDALDLCMTAATHVSGFECSGVYLTNEATGDLELASHIGLSEAFVKAVRSVSPGEPAAHQVFAGTPLYDRAEALEGDLGALVRQEGLCGMASIPLCHDGAVVGCVNLASRTRDEVSPSSRRALEGIAEQMGSALARLHAENSLRLHVKLERLIASLAARFIRADYGEIDGEIQRALREIGEFTGEDRCYITVISLEKGTVLESFEWCAEGVTPGDAVLSDAAIAEYQWATDQLADNELLHVPDLETLPPESGTLGDLLRSQGVMSLVNVPLVGSKSKFGYFGFDAVRQRKRWSEDTIALLRVIGHVFGSAIERKYGERTLRFHQEFERLIATLSTQFISVSPQRLNSGLRDSLRTIGEFTGVDRAYISLLSEDERTFLHGYEWCAENVPSFLTVSDGFSTTEFSWGEARLHDHQVLHVPRVADLGPEAARERAFLQAQGVVSTVIVPLVSGRRLVGLFGLEMVRGELTWPGETISLLMILGHVFGNAIRRRREDAQRRKLEEQFQQAQKLESLGALAGGIAHDFNNLLMGILGNAGLALLDLPPDSPALESISQIETAAMRAADLTKQLLAYSGRGRIDAQPVDLPRVAQDMAHLLETAVSKKAILRYDFVEDLPLVKGDATQVRQVIMNLVTNASDAIGNRSGVITVRTDSVYADEEYLSQTYLNEDLPEGQYVFVEVADTGCGMDAETEARIFDPFFTTKFVGRGLGLAAVLGIVRGHRGALHVHSRPGQGTTIRVLFPVAETAPQPGTTPSTGEGAGTTSKKGGGTFLVVDDEEMVRNVAKDVLERAGFKVILAHDGVEAIELFTDHGADCVGVLLDLTMPHMPGEEAYRELRRLSKDVPIIISSGYDESRTVGHMTEDKACRFLPKPYRPGALLDAVHAILDREPEARSE